MPNRAKPADTARTATRAVTNADSATGLLGGRSPKAFLREFWQKEALLVRGAMPGFAGLFDEKALFALAARDDVESRLIVREGRRWSLTHGPFRRADRRALPAHDWTLLVQGVNLHSEPADALLRCFSFLPYARLDDLMVSYAAKGGGVGPHFDSYDVFLLQGFGRRRWQYGRQDDLALLPRLPVKILARFAPEHDLTLAPGDMLYLPPQIAHDGVALEPCTTYSIGFRAAGATEMAVAFLDFLRDELALPGRYADPGLAPTRTPARIDTAMRRQGARMLAGIRWDAQRVARFLGCWLSEPKPEVFFDPPAPALARAPFVAAATRHGLRLNMRTQLLYDEQHLYLNGTALRWPAQDAAALARLADFRTLAPRAVAGLAADTQRLLHDWYRDGFLHADRE